MVGVVGQFSLEFLDSFGILLLRPKQIAEAEVHVWFIGLGFDCFAEHVDGARSVAHFIEGFAGQHVGFGGVGIEGEDFFVDIEDAVDIALTRDSCARGQGEWADSEDRRPPRS